MANALLIQVLKDAIQREEERIERARREIWRLKMELLEEGVELPLHEGDNHGQSAGDQPL